MTKQQDELKVKKGIEMAGLVGVKMINYAKLCKGAMTL